jgi:hypothetical protein
MLDPDSSFAAPSGTEAPPSIGRACGMAEAM